MDFGALPPEVNSARLYAGPGPGSLLAAAASWRTLAGELGSVASHCRAMIDDLAGQAWLGPASESMAAAATPYAEWLGATGALAAHTADRMMQSAGDFEQAFAASVPPPAIAANRTRLAALVAADVFGQNAAAIAETEAAYGQMWLQDATAMYGYAARSAAATAITSFTAPPSVVNPAGPAGQSAATSAQATPPDPVAQAASYIETVTRSILPANDANISALYGMGQYARNLNTDLDISQATGGRAGFGSGARAVVRSEESVRSAGGARPTVTASTGSAGAVGKLAVPRVWIDSVPEATTTTTAAPAAAPAAAPGAGIAVAGLAGRADRRRRGRVETHGERTAGELIGTGDIRHWHAEPGELKSLLGEVAAQPGVHEVYFDTDELPGSCGGPSFAPPSSSLAEPPKTGR